MNSIKYDQRFQNHFNGRLRQVFFYVTDECNLRCTQCYYKPWLKKWKQGVEMEFETAKALLKYFRELGAIKVSFLGGEPTRYGIRGKNPGIGKLIEYARDLGFDYIRMVTNGLFKESLLKDDGLRLIDEITISIDGDTSSIHDPLRGKGTFERTTSNIQKAILEGYNVHLTTCVHKLNSTETEKGELFLQRAVKWASELGASLINFHPLFKMGIDRDSWTGDFSISPDNWSYIYTRMRRLIDTNKFPIPVRIPQRFIKTNEFESNKEYYGYCPVKLAERLEIHSNGQIHSCALHNGTPISLAHYSTEENIVNIKWANEANEIDEYPFSFKEHHPCVVMRKDFSDYVPLCISFKPKQQEPVWETLGFDKKINP